MIQATKLTRTYYTKFALSILQVLAVTMEQPPIPQCYHPGSFGDSKDMISGRANVSGEVGRASSRVSENSSWSPEFTVGSPPLPDDRRSNRDEDVVDHEHALMLIRLASPGNAASPLKRKSRVDSTTGREGDADRPRKLAHGFLGAGDGPSSEHQRWGGDGHYQTGYSPEGAGLETSRRAGQVAPPDAASFVDDTYQAMEEGNDGLWRARAGRMPSISGSTSPGLGPMAERLEYMNKAMGREIAALSLESEAASRYRKRCLGLEKENEAIKQQLENLGYALQCEKRARDVLKAQLTEMKGQAWTLEAIIPILFTRLQEVQKSADVASLADIYSEYKDKQRALEDEGESLDPS